MLGTNDLVEATKKVVDRSLYAHGTIPVAAFGLLPNGRIAIVEHITGAASIRNMLMKGNAQCYTVTGTASPESGSGILIFILAVENGKGYHFYVAEVMVIANHKILGAWKEQFDSNFAGELLISNW